MKDFKSRVVKHIATVALFTAFLIVLNQEDDTQNHRKKITELTQKHRQITVYLGNGKCRYEDPIDTPEELDFLKTLIVGYPNGDKRITFAQMEGLTGFRTKDEWDLENSGQTNDPFVKTNYPHHEGIWSWEDNAQVVLVIRNIRTAMIHYHDVLWDLGYAENYVDAQTRADKLYGGLPSKSEFVKWRDENVIQEIRWYGWFIDYWMEGGIMRDVFTHNLTTPEHWDILRTYSRNTDTSRYVTGDLSYEAVVGNTEVDTTYDPHCLHDFAEGCKPVAIISAEELISPETGPVENHLIAKALQGKKGIGDFIIDRDAWDCVWEELIVNKKGPKTFLDRVGDSEKEFNFSAEVLNLMLEEINRLITKYSDLVWIISPKVPVLVSILTEHRRSLEAELAEVESGRRKLEYNDFLGPETRARREKEIAGGNLYW